VEKQKPFCFYTQRRHIVCPGRRHERAYGNDYQDKFQAEGKLMIVTAHLPLFLIGNNATNPYIDAKTLLEKLQTYP
jgi:hypothetical protein